MNEAESPQLARIAVHPIKSLEPVKCDSARIVPNGGLEHDREYAIFDESGNYVNGKRTADVHRLRSSFDDDMQSVKLRRETDGTDAGRQFDLGADQEALADWLGDHFGQPVSLERDTQGDSRMIPHFPARR